MTTRRHDSLVSPFNQLPGELKELVWRQLLLEDVPEVAIYPGGLRPILPLGPRPHDEEDHFLLVYTAYPVLMHVCREWRAYAVPRTPFRYSPAARMDVPTRGFRPELDILYLPASGINGIWTHEDRRTPAARQVAMAPRAFLDCGARSLALLTHFKHLERLTIVLPASTGQHRLSQALTPPARRCKLRPIAAASLDDVGVLSVMQPGPSPPARISAFVQWVEEVVQRAGQYLLQTEERDSPPAAGQGARRPRLPRAKSQTFVEYQLRDGQPRWLEYPEGGAT